MEVIRLSDLDPSRERPESAESLPVEQRAALQAAVERGYYETPRRIDLSDLAEELSVPRSTLSYRLRRAKASLATAFVADNDSLEAITTGD